MDDLKAWVKNSDNYDLVIIEVEAIWHISIEPDFEYKDKPPFPPKIKVLITIPDTRYRILECTDNIAQKSYFTTGYLQGKKFGFYIQYNPDKNPNTQIERNIRDLNRKYHLNIDEDYRITSIKNLYYYGYFREGNYVNIKSKEKIILSKKYIMERMKENTLV